MKDLGWYCCYVLKSAMFVSCVLGFGFILSMPVIGLSGQYLVATQAADKKDFDSSSKNYLSILNNDYYETIIVQAA